MKAAFHESFLRDVKGIKDKTAISKIKAVIETVERANTFDEILHLKKMRGSRGYFRIRVGDFRIGIKLEGETIVFLDALIVKIFIDTFLEIRPRSSNLHYRRSSHNRRLPTRYRTISK